MGQGGQVRRHQARVIREISVSASRKQQRLDNNRNNAGRVDELADVDEVELLQANAVDRHKLAFVAKLLVNDAAEATADIAVDHEDEQILANARGSGKPHDRSRDRGESRIIRIAGERECEVDLGVRGDIENVGAFRESVDYRIFINIAGKSRVEMDDRNIMYRQHTGVGQLDGLAAHLNGKLRSADSRRANALGRFYHGHRSPHFHLSDDLVGQGFRNVAVVGGFAAEYVLRDPAREGYDGRPHAA